LLLASAGFFLLFCAPPDAGSRSNANRQGNRVFIVVFVNSRKLIAASSAGAGGKVPGIN
jgi:hypothetical protein